MQTNSNYDKLIKLTIIGDSKVGKSSFLIKLTDNKFSSNYSKTIGVEFGVKILTTSTNKKIKAQIWDTAGSEEYKQITKSYIKNSPGYILMYDINNRESFDNLNYWLDIIMNCNDKDYKVLLIGNKNDLDGNGGRKVGENEGREFAEDRGFDFFEISCKFGGGEFDGILASFLNKF